MRVALALLFVFWAALAALSADHGWLIDPDENPRPTNTEPDPDHGWEIDPNG
jgi:hypothetical protein